MGRSIAAFVAFFLVWVNGASLAVKALPRFGDLQLVSHRWSKRAADIYHNSTMALNTGFIAQAVQKQFPELASIDKRGYRQLDYTTRSLYGLEAIKELKASKDAQEHEIAALHAADRTQANDLRQLRGELHVFESRAHIQTAQT